MSSLPKLSAGPRGPMFEVSRPERPDSTDFQHSSLAGAIGQGGQTAPVDSVDAPHQPHPAWAYNRFEDAVQRASHGVREPNFAPHALSSGRERLPVTQDVLGPEGGESRVDANPAAMSNVIATGASFAGPLAATGALLAGGSALWSSAPKKDG